MHCIQNTTARIAVLEWVGAAPDAAFSGLRPVLARRLSIAVGGMRGCCSEGPTLIAVDPTDPLLTPAVRAGLRELGPGTAVAARGAAELVGATVAAPGVTIRVHRRCEADGNLIVIAFDDAVAMLSAPGADRLLVRTTALVHVGPTVPTGWTLTGIAEGAVPLTTSLQHRGEHVA